MSHATAPSQSASTQPPPGSAEALESPSNHDAILAMFLTGGAGMALASATGWGPDWAGFLIGFAGAFVGAVLWLSHRG
jgi:hypothetical protein